MIIIYLLIYISNRVTVRFRTSCSGCVFQSSGGWTAAMNDEPTWSAATAAFPRTKSREPAACHRGHYRATFSRVLLHVIATICVSKNIRRLSRASAETRENRRLITFKEAKGKKTFTSFSSFPFWFFFLFGLFRASVEIKRRRGSSTRGMPAGWRPRYLEKNWTTSSTRYAVR